MVWKIVGAAALVTRPAILSLVMHDMIVSYVSIDTSGRVRKDEVLTSVGKDDALNRCAICECPLPNLLKSFTKSYSC